MENGEEREDFGRRNTNWFQYRNKRPFIVSFIPLESDRSGP